MRYWLFDVLQLAGEDVRDARLPRALGSSLDNELEPALTGDARVLPVASGAKAKRALHDKLRAANAEGIVFKQRDAPYTSGRVTHAAQVQVRQVRRRGHRRERRQRVSHGACATARTMFDCRPRVRRHDERDRARSSMRGSRARRSRSPRCSYLYATDDHQLFQPVFVRLRDDKLAKACLRDQLVRTDRTVL